MFVIGTHEVDDVAHWANSPKRAEFFESRGMKVHAFVDPAGASNVTAVMIETPDMETLQRAQEDVAGAESQKHDGVRVDTIAMFVPVGEASN